MKISKEQPFRDKTLGNLKQTLSLWTYCELTIRDSEKAERKPFEQHKICHPRNSISF